MNETKAERGLQVVANLATILSALRGLSYLVVIVGLPVIGCQALPLINRAVGVLENMDERVERAFQGAAPIAREVVTKGLDAVSNVDGKKLGSELTEAAKRLLRKGSHKK